MIRFEKNGRFLYIQIFIGSFYERRGKIGTPGRGKKIQFASDDERNDAIRARVRELEEDGWKLVRGANEIPRAKRKAPNPLEAAFGKLVADTIVGLKKAKSTAEDARVWKRAIAAYGKLKVKCGGNADENLVHFFAVDGIALEARHPVVVQAVAASDERKNFWLKTLEKP